MLYSKLKAGKQPVGLKLSLTVLVSGVCGGGLKDGLLIIDCLAEIHTTARDDSQVQDRALEKY